MAQGATKKDPAAELRDALIAALIDIPFMNALPDRRLLINLVRRDVVNFPDVQERAEARLHVVEIVLACLGHPGGLRALKSGLATMAPDAPGAKRASQLIDSATLLSLLPDREAKQVHDLLHRAEGQFPDPGWWRTHLDESLPLPAQAKTLTNAFDHYANQPVGRHAVPPALALISRVTQQLEGPITVELYAWAEEQAERVERLDDFRLLHRPAAGEPPAGEPATREPAAGGPAIEVTADNSAGGRSAPPIAEQADPVGEDRVPYVVVRETSVSTSDSPSITADGIALGDDPVDVDSRGTENAELGDAMSPVATPTRPADRLPRVWGDVPQRNPDFTGREDLLELLHAQLQVARETAVLPQALHGMGGVGKSQIAIEYVHRHSSEYDLIWWVPSEQNGQILASLTKLAQRLGLDVGPEANTAVPAVREALSTGRIPYQNWLLVFDNAEAPKDVRAYFPTGGAGKILVTSRNPDWARGGRALEVDVFTREESVTFLINRNPDMTEHEADQLAEALGDLPLAIEQAAAWHATTGMSVRESLQLLANKRIELLDASPSPDYPVTVAAAWNVSLDKLRRDNEAALQLLQVCSFFAPEPISRDLFAGSPTAPITPELDATLSDTFRLSRAIRDIQRLALARIDHRANTLQIHRLIQMVLAASMDPEQQEIMRHGAHTLLANSNPQNPSRRDTWDRYHAIRPHVAVSRAVESADPRVQELVLGIVQFLYYWGDHAGSEALAQEAYEYRLRDRGEGDPHTLRLAKWLGWMRFVNGKYAEASELNRRTLRLYRETVGDDDEGTLDAMWVVAVDLRSTGDFAAALELDQRAFEAAKRAFGADDPATLIGANSLGVSLRLTGDFKGAAKLDEETHRRRAIVLGPDDEATLNSLNNYVIDLRESGQYLEARRRQEAVYERHLAAFDSDTPATLRAARSLAVARRKAGAHPEALKLAEITLEKYQRRYGDDFPDTIATAVNYAVDLRHAREFEKARELGEHILVRYRKLFGAAHAYTLSARTNLAIVLRLQGAPEEAYRHDREALEAMDATLGADHPVTLTCATNLASDLFALDDVQAAFERDTDTLARSERTLGVEHPSTLACSVNLALDLRGLGRTHEADRMLADTMTRLRRVLGERHPATLNALQSLRADCDIDPMPL